GDQLVRVFSLPVRVGTVVRLELCDRVSERRRCPPPPRGDDDRVSFIVELLRCNHCQSPISTPNAASISKRSMYRFVRSILKCRWNCSRMASDEKTSVSIVSLSTSPRTSPT